ncbi:Uncharacterized protein Adt_22423 [Abeliophyllum distichum]|uniref:Uncharacterized protein n=1 Tax=Abeliophyllum distichum TaxID=126358 RepID=A0ABD1T247_9LAMI
MFHTLESNPLPKSPKRVSSSSAPNSKKGVTSHLTESPSALPLQTSTMKSFSNKRPSSHQADDSDEEDTSVLVKKKDADSALLSIHALFTSWEQVEESSISRSSSATHLSTSSIPSTDEMNALKKSVMAYASFTDKDISRASVANQKKLLAHLSEDLAYAIQRPTIDLPADIRLTLRGIHQEVSLLMSENSKLKREKTSFVQAVAEKESLNSAIDKAKSTLNELSSEVVIENSQLMSLEAKMRDIQAKIDECKMHLATKKHNASQEIERTRALMAHYSEITIDDPNMVMEELSTIDTRQRFEWSKLHSQMRSILEMLDLAGQ